MNSGKSTIKYCPKCKTANLDIVSGWLTGSYHCRKCGYMGPIILEKDIDKK